MAQQLMTWLKVGLIKFTNYNMPDHSLEEARGMLIVVATMIATLNFQSAMNPPGGVWQDNYTDKTLYGLQICSEKDVCIAGTAILGYIWKEDMLQFMRCNTVSFVASLSITIFLISGFPLTNRFCIWLLSMAMCVSVTFTGLSYLIAVFMVMPVDEGPFYVHKRSSRMGLEVWAALLAMVATFHTIRFLTWLGKKVNSHFKIF